MDINFEILPLVSLKHIVVASHESFCKNLVDYFRQAALVMLGTGMGLILSPFSCLYGDVNRGIGFVNRFWIFVTPVIYPQLTEGLWGILVAINPVTPLLVTTRDLITTGEITNLTGFWITSAIALITTFVGWIFYRLSLPFLVERA